MSKAVMKISNNCHRGKSKSNINYITRGDSDYKIFGIDGETEIEKRRHLKQVWNEHLDSGNKMKRSDYRVILSMPKSDCDYETFRSMVYEFRRKTFKYNIGCVAVHQDKPGHYDAHIIVNARTITGKAVRMKKDFEQNAKERWKSIGKKYGIGISYIPREISYEERGEIWAQKKIERERYKKSIEILNKFTPELKKQMASEDRPDIDEINKNRTTQKPRNIHERAEYVRQMVLVLLHKLKDRITNSRQAPIRLEKAEQPQQGHLYPRNKTSNSHDKINGIDR